MPILVVDDEKSIARLIRIILQRHGFNEIILAHSGFEALEVMGVEHPGMKGRERHREPAKVDLVMLDIVLPNLNGFDVCRSIKGSLDHYVPIMLMTGFNIEQHHARYIESGADDFLTKPINPQELITRVNLHLSRKRKMEGETDTPGPRAPAGALIEMTEIGPYTLEKPLAWSGSVAIYKARHGSEHVVIKILTRQAQEYEDVVQRFAREAELMTRFDHPNVIHLLNRGEHHGLPYYVMEFVDGQNLELYSAEHPQAPFEVVVNVACSLARALEHVHGHDVVHRDIKLKNIFLDRRNQVKLGDFGIALSMGDLRLTQSGYAIGTPIYMAPEQFEGQNVTASADIYSFGASLYHIITGSTPFTAGNAMELLRKHLHEKPLPLNRRRPGVPNGWNELIVERCLAKEPADRPADMAEVLATLEALRTEPF